MDTFRVVVDYSKTVAELLEGGDYDWTDDDVIGRNVLLTGSGIVEQDFILYHLNYVASTKEVLIALDRCGLRPATNHELLSFGIAYPGFQEEFPIIQLGTILVAIGGGLYVSLLGLDPWTGARFAAVRHPYDYSERWSAICRFLAVRKK